MPMTDVDRRLYDVQSELAGIRDTLTSRGDPDSHLAAARLEAALQEIGTTKQILDEDRQ